ncbi:MAG: rRNA maturation RNase YbeY [Chthoniobacterales bacterium]
MRPPSSPQIFVHNRQRKIAIDRVRLENLARSALPLCLREPGSGLTDLEKVDVLLVSDRRIAELHLRFMRIPGPTDVITFQHGEIFVSLETARRQAEFQQTSLPYELLLYLVHGLLHLRGLDDQEPVARSKMHAVQKKIVDSVLG